MANAAPVRVLCAFLFMRTFLSVNESTTGLSLVGK
jgi:hypothetical protein